MNIKVKLIMSYLLVTLFIVVLSVTFISSNKRVTGFINNEMMDMLSAREIANAVNNEFKNIVISLKSARASKDTKEIADFKKENAESFAKIEKALNRKPDDPVMKKFMQISANMKSKSDKFLETKAEYIKDYNAMMLLFDDMDSLFRKQKGYIFVTRMNLEKFGNRYKNTIAFIERMMEDPLEIKVYISEIVNAKDEVDAEDGVFTLVHYAEILTAKANTLLNGGEYKGNYVVRLKDEEHRKRIEMLLEVTASMIEESDNLQTIRLKTISLEKDLEIQIAELETIVDSTAKELKILTKTAKTQMDDGSTGTHKLKNAFTCCSIFW